MSFSTFVPVRTHRHAHSFIYVRTRDKEFSLPLDNINDNECCFRIMFTYAKCTSLFPLTHIRGYTYGIFLHSKLDDFSVVSNLLFVSPA